MQHSTLSADARLQMLLSAVQSRWGRAGLQPLSHLSRSPQAGLRTGFADLDARLSPAGIPQGAVTLLGGRPTSGMMTLAYRALGLAQENGAHVLYVDQESTFDPDSAAQGGVDLQRLYLIRPEDSHEALEMVRDVVQTVPIGALVLDAGQGCPSGEALRRLDAALAKRGPALLVLNWLLDQRTARIFSSLPAALRLHFDRVGWLHADGAIAGCRARVRRVWDGDADLLTELDIPFVPGRKVHP